MPDPTVRFAIRPAGHAGVIVDRTTDANGSVNGSIMIAEPPNHSAGYQGGGPGPGEVATTLIVLADSPAVATTVWYVAWVQLPAGTAYVAYAFGSDHQWQVPINGAAIFTFVGANRLAGVPAPVEIAYDAAGNKLGEARPYSREWS